MRKSLAFDFGASSGRAMLGAFDGKTIWLEEAHRFDNTPVMLRGTFYWDILRLFQEIKNGLLKAGDEYTSIGIDTWGVDFGLLDEEGRLLENPVHYRDARTEGLMEAVAEKLGPDALYQRTGTQVMALNTVFQMLALARQRPELLERASTALLMPDLFGYFLTGEKTAEYTHASTTQLMNPHTHAWDADLMGELGFRNLFPDIVAAGSPLGVLSQEIRDELRLPAARVISVAGHDTASAVVAVPAEEKDFLYLSCGTWSLLGTELQSPVITEKTQKYNITNEGGYGFTIRLLKNIAGLWLIQETKRQYEKEGQKYSYAELVQLAEEAEPLAFFVNPDAPEFAVPGNYPKQIADFCERTGQGRPRTVGQTARCVYESLAMKYRHVVEQLQECTGKKYHTLHMVGGGIQAKNLCQMAANATGCRVVAGPVEATALGNIAVQLMAEGQISDIWEARCIIRASAETVEYLPENTEKWDKAYEATKAVML